MRPIPRKTLMLTALWLSAAAAAPAQSYTFQTFHVPYPPRNNTYVQAMNNRGAIVGYMDFSHRIHGYLGVADRGFKLDADGVFEYPIIDPNDGIFVTVPTGINDYGVIVGHYGDAQGVYHGFILNNGAFTTVDVNGGPNTWVSGINDSGDFVGEYGTDPLYPENGFVSRGGVISPIAVPGTVATRPFAIATDGTVVGVASYADHDSVFVMGPKSNISTFRIAGAVIQIPYAINNEVHLIAGTYTDASHGYHGFTYDYLSQAAQNAPDGATVTVNTIDYPGETEMTLNAVNANGTIAGSAITQASGHFFGFIGTPAP